MTQDEKKAIVAEVKEVLKQRKGNAPVDRNQPLLEGDKVTFKVPDGGKVSDLLIFHPQTVNDSGTAINEYFAVKTADGREVTQTQLVGRRGNGLSVLGETPDERLENFLADIAENGSKQIEVGKLRILPSTRADWNSQRIITWVEA